MQRKESKGILFRDFHVPNGSFPLFLQLLGLNELPVCQLLVQSHAYNFLMIDVTRRERVTEVDRPIHFHGKNDSRHIQFPILLIIFPPFLQFDMIISSSFLFQITATTSSQR